MALRCRRDRDGRPIDPRLELIGSKTRPHVLTFERGHEIAAVRIKLEWVEPLLGLGPSDHRDLEYDLSPVLPRFAGALFDRLVETRSAGEAVDAVASALLARSRRTSAPAPTVAAVALDVVRRTTGRLTVEQVGAGMGVSLRHLRRSVRREAGMSLKAYARTTRFLRAVTAADRTPAPPWARIASDAGFCDQSHFVRDCRALTGLAPGQVFRERRAQAEISNRG